MAHMLVTLRLPYTQSKQMCHAWAGDRHASMLGSCAAWCMPPDGNAAKLSSQQVHDICTGWEAVVCVNVDYYKNLAVHPPGRLREAAALTASASTLAGVR